MEYALEAVKLGNLAIGLKTQNHVILAVEKKSSKKLQEPRSFKKIGLIDNHVVSAFTGLGADARILVNKARIDAQSFRLTYDETPSINYLSRRVSALMQKYTQKGGARPFGFSIMLAGIDEDGKPNLNQIDPSGMITCYRANSIGNNSKHANEILEKNYKMNMTLEEGLNVVAMCLHDSIDHPKKNSEIVIVSREKIEFMKEEEISALFEGLDEE